MASGEADETLFLDPSQGRHELVVVDRSGRTDRIFYEVLGSRFGFWVLGAPEVRHGKLTRRWGALA